MQKEYFLFVNGNKVMVSEDVYKAYWQEKNHENYLKQVDRKNHLLLFSSFDNDGHFEESIIDEGIDVEKIVQTQIMIDAVRKALSKLNDDEREIVEKLYYDEESIRSISKKRNISHPALIKKKNKILDKLKKLLKDFR
ncbi:hypothetical protein HMPREF1142_1743 [Peptostreptococcaceae bacterium AS15]|nr:hypothetical protein HMPREF1142_1743 [Peptostreptococcaceae bacterium AS15]